MSETLQTTALHSLHQSLKAKLVPFAGYEMPVQYQGLMAEHKHTREHAGLFDVSHMGQCVLSGEHACEQLETLVTADLKTLAINTQQYTVFTNSQGGIEDDLIITRWAEDSFFLVVNAACKTEDFARLNTLKNTDLRLLEDQALIALQGPEARAVLSALNPAVGNLTFMKGSFIELLGARCYVTCSGYTGEDGYEISCPNSDAEAIAKALLTDERVAPVGLGARDSLRLEAGLCLYGHDLDTNTTPVEASLVWAIAKNRRTEGSFIGSEVIVEQIKNGANRKRVGLSIEGRAPVREGAEIFTGDQQKVGTVTSGTFSPSLGKPIAMGYVASHALTQDLYTIVRGKTIALNLCKMPFVAQRYFRG